MYEENKRNSRQNCMAPGLRSDELVVTGEGPVLWALAKVGVAIVTGCYNGCHVLYCRDPVGMVAVVYTLT